MSDQADQPEIRRFSVPVVPSDHLRIMEEHAANSNQPFRPLPPPTGQAPYHLDLASVLPAATIQQITTDQRLTLHIVGDTGGVKSPQDQQIVADHMVADLKQSGTAFFYHLGDVVYYYGETSNYYDQYYDPYKLYNAPIFAIPGNHDGDLAPGSQAHTLDAFINNFCATEPHTTPEAGDVVRDAMTQPNVYWTLETPLLTIIGLYTNVPEGGQLDDQQIAWLSSELSSAPQNKPLIVTLHHPIYSADAYHSGSAYMSKILDDAIQGTGRIPDAVFSGHVHNYQRFTRSYNGRQIPYIVAGGGGYWHLHSMEQVNGQPITTPYPIPGSEVVLNSYSDDRHGFMRLEVTPKAITGTYMTVPRSQEAWSAPSAVLDTFTLDLQTHQVS